MKRVVVTGMGIVSSIGNSTQEVVASLREAKSGISAAEEYTKLGFRCQVHGNPNLDPTDMIDRLAWAMNSANVEPFWNSARTNASGRSVRAWLRTTPNSPIISFEKVSSS